MSSPSSYSSSFSSPPCPRLVTRGKAGDHVVIDDLLSSEECDAIIIRCVAWHKARINLGDGEEELDEDERKHMRCYLDDAGLASDLLLRVMHAAPYIGEHGTTYINPRLRVLRYTKGDYFKPHWDGEQEWTSPTGERFVSKFTIIFYLSDSEGNEAGGSTHFCDTGERVVPQKGRALIFVQDETLHEGEEVLYGTKMVARTDIGVLKGRE